jgi:hypothetical protein
VRPMSWDDVRNIYKHGHTIGAHTSWHAILTNESVDDAANDIRASIQAVSTNIGIACETFSFPNGSSSDALVRIALSCGVQTVMTTDPTWVTRSTSLWHLPRIQLFPIHSDNHCVLKLTAALCGGTLVNPNGTGRRYARQSIVRQVRDLLTGCLG